MKYDTLDGVKETIIKIVDIATMLIEPKILIVVRFLIHHILNSLLASLASLKVLIQLKRISRTLMTLSLYVLKKKEEFFMK